MIDTGSSQLFKLDKLAHAAVVHNPESESIIFHGAQPA
ncbi:hypothetical protein FEAC_24280 [Ferrimicrobium acidiphilum DSM 19497]|uniref:Uncharacterized protein n=1 Tax=Ferrimicrobium acidiphilum DSM 19497 TaxID=1121877 RepID=A0A0D8FRG2_9ACTN|nr:hypothetical protein FEAC_24280 [Ferrimicrobium acidiphilum DSM 19497]